MFFISCQDDFTDDLPEDINRNDIELETRSVDSLCFMTWNTGLIDTPFGDGFDLSDGFRAEKICDRIMEENLDVIMLQEVWDREDQQFLKNVSMLAGMM